MKTKFLALLLACSLCMAFLPATAHAAEAQVLDGRLEIVAEPTLVGNTLTVRVSAVNNSGDGFSGVKFTLKYQAEKVTYQSTAKGSIPGLIEVNSKENPLVCVWANSDNVTGNLLFTTHTFTVNAGSGITAETDLASLFTLTVQDLTRSDPAQPGKGDHPLRHNTVSADFVQLAVDGNGFRVIGTVARLDNIENVGFHIKAGLRSYNNHTDKVYSAMKSATGSTVDGNSPGATFDYFYAATLKAANGSIIPFGTVFEITPYYTSESGTVYYGETVTFQYQ